MTSICPKCLLNTFSKFWGVYLRKYTNFDKMSAFLETEPFFVGFGTNADISPHIHEGFQVSNYLVVSQFDKQALKTHIVKKYKDRIISTFFTVKEVVQDWVNDSPFNLTVITIPKKSEVMKRSDLTLYHKSCLGKRNPWY